MNRVIKFRGKKQGSSSWVYGDLKHDKGISSTGLYDRVTVAGYPVEENTVEQFTGLLDKNGKEIYEGDILSVCNGSINRHPWMDKPYPVEYQINKGFVMPMFIWDKEGNDRSDNTHWCEVIGNIHDNPELLKGGDE